MKSTLQYYLGNLVLEAINRKLNIVSIMQELDKQIDNCKRQIVVQTEVGNYHLVCEMILDVLARSVTIPLKKLTEPSEKVVEIIFDFMSENMIEFWAEKEEAFTDNEDEYIYRLESEELIIEYDEMEYNRVSIIPTCTKTIDKADNKIYYSLYFEIESYNKDGDIKNRFYKSILIYDEVGSDGKFGKYIDERIDDDWQSFYKLIPCDDSFAAHWITKLITETKNGILHWNGVHTNYKEFEIVLNKYDHLWGTEFKRFDQPCDCHTLTVRTSAEYCTKFYQINDNEQQEYFIDELMDLALKHQAEFEKSTLKEQKIKFSDIVVQTNYLKCKDEMHSIIPVRGIISIMTFDNELIEKEVYVGYCSKCHVYFMFRSDFVMLKRSGTLLCKIYNFKEWFSDEKIKDGNFKYKAQSLLNAYGYNVNKIYGLTDENRKYILEHIITNEIMKQDEVIVFLQWLITVHKNQSSMKEAVQKWECDMEYIKNLPEMEKVKVDSVTLR